MIFLAAIMTSGPLYAWIIKLTSWRIAFVVAGVKIFVFGGICSLLFLLKVSKDSANIYRNTSFFINLLCQWQTQTNLLFIINNFIYPAIIYVLQIPPVACP